MKENKVKILSRAWDDITLIEDYSYLQFGLESAQKVTNQILLSLEKLQCFSQIDVPTPDKKLNKMGYRMYIINKNYVAIIKHIDDSIYIYRIINTKRHYSKLF